MNDVICPRYKIYRIKSFKSGVDKYTFSFGCSVIENNGKRIITTVATTADNIDKFSISLMQYKSSVQWSELENLSTTRVKKGTKGFCELHFPLSKKQLEELAVKLTRF